MTVLLPFVINAGLNFVLGLLIAYFLGPAEFGRYAIGAAMLVLLNTALLDWIRLSAVRFYSQKTREEQPQIRATLDVLSAGITLALCGILVAAVVAGVDFGLPVMLVAGSVLGGICAGLFDYHGAIARARFLDAAYARLIIVKNVLALLLMVGGAWWTRDATVVMFGGVLSAMAALLAVRRALADGPLAWSAARRDLASDFARYALPIVGANAIYSLIPLLNRSLLADSNGFAEAGYFSLAADMGLRLFGMLATTLEIVMLREVLRLDETKGVRAAQKRIAANFVIVLMVSLPVAAGLFLVLPAFEALLVPAKFHGHFSGYLQLLLPGLVALAVFAAGIYPVFLLGKRTGLVTLAALAGLLVNLALVFSAGALGPERYALGQTLSFLVVLAITGWVGLRSLPVSLNWREIGIIIAAVVAMAIVVWPLSGRLSPLPELLLQGTLGLAVYGGLMLAFDVARCRTLLRLWLAIRKSRR
ncbi:lipopolysaccharide biosynthesis protein [Bosea sp. CCNWLW174]|uniref:lipopolysaccharide biosynthesis protein n=1 Tax=unclassified Bosea (in: a-proteobacteria) TaxID=2653178 RepID=UPI003014F31E